VVPQTPSVPSRLLPEGGAALDGSGRLGIIHELPQRFLDVGQHLCFRHNIGPIRSPWRSPSFSSDLMLGRCWVRTVCVPEASSQPARGEPPHQYKAKLAFTAVGTAASIIGPPSPGTGPPSGVLPLWQWGWSTDHHGPSPSKGIPSSPVTRLSASCVRKPCRPP
jgi:hypothetical protein